MRLLVIFFKPALLTVGIIALLCGYQLRADPTLPVDYYAYYWINSLLGICILLDLLHLAINSLDAPGWMPRHPSAGFDGLDIALCLLFACLTLTPWGLLAVLTDAATKLFSRWAQALQESHA